MSVSGGSVTEATISGLTPFTIYSIEVAAVNSIGTGVYSNPIIAKTPLMGKCTCHLQLHFCVDLYCTLQVYFSVTMMTSSLIMAMWISVILAPLMTLL